MKSRKTCYSIKDIKTTCPTCKVRAFASHQALLDDSDGCLICWNCGYAIKHLDYTKEWACGDPPSTDIYDIIYEGETRWDEDLKEVKSKFPNAVFNRNWDDIHGYRTVVTIEGSSYRDYFYTLIKSGLANMSFDVQMALRDKDSSTQKDLISALEEIKNQKE